MLYDQKNLEQLISPELHLVLLDRIDSTNTYCRDHLLPHLTLCITNEQTQGRGRLGKSWFSSKEAIAFSFVYDFAFYRPDHCALTLVIGLSLARGLASLGFADLALKWPNDLFQKGEKIAGILVESHKRAGPSFIIGVGLNYALNGSYTALIGPVIPREQIIAAILDQLMTDLLLFEQQGFSAFYALWDEYDFLKGKNISFYTPEHAGKGLYLGLDEKGYIRIKETDRNFVLNSATIRIDK